jgi:hypothetical protein
MMIDRPMTEPCAGSRITDQSVAKRIWSASGHRINPRYLRRPGIVAERYDLTEQRDGKWTIAAAGKDLIASEVGATETGIDLQEGMGEFLELIQVKRTLAVVICCRGGVSSLSLIPT